jgi:hypothetical protein
MPANNFGEVDRVAPHVGANELPSTSSGSMPLVSTSPRFPSIKVSSILSKQ